MDMMDSCRSQASSIPNGVVLEVFTREYLMKALVDFPPSRKNGDRKWEKWNARGRIYRSDVYIRFRLFTVNGQLQCFDLMSNF